MVQKVGFLMGRILLSAIFLMSGLGKLTNFTGTQQYMANYGMPMTKFFLICAIILEIGGGLSILLGYRAKWGALALVIFLIPATLIFHTRFSDQIQMIMFMKNLAIMGGLVLIATQGAGPLSIDAIRKQTT
jgi:putative oxidoreductase